MIFLGAGASKVFGIKTLQEMTDDLVNKMRDNGYGLLMDELVGSLKKFGLTPDFESIYTILEALKDPKEAVRDAGPFTAYVCKDLKDIETHPEFERLLNEFRLFIYEECTIKQKFLDKLKSAYDNLFRIFRENPIRESRIFTTSMSKPDVIDTNIGYTIATTNYDMSVELYHRMTKQTYADGFRETNDPYVREMDVKTYADLGNYNWLIKLHGSIWQFKQGNRIIKTIADPKSSPIPIKIDEQIMIYPTGEKPVLKDPYYYFYEIFKAQRWGRLIAVGYSFRDEPINTAILENLEKVQGSTLIVVDPNAENVIKNLGASAPQDRIIPITGKFGIHEVFRKMEIAVGVSNRKKFKEQILLEHEKLIKAFKDLTQ